MVGEMQCPSVVGLHTLLNGTHWKNITKRKARVPSMLMTMKEMIIFDSLGWCVPLITRRMNRHTEVLISPVAIVACISAMVVHFEASDSVGSTYIVCLPNPRCVCLAFVAPPKIQTAYEYVLIRRICLSSENGKIELPEPSIWCSRPSPGPVASVSRRNVAGRRLWLVLG